MVNVSWEDVLDYVDWLSRETGEEYRLLSESEWEYVARAGTVGRYHLGNGVGRNRANCYGCWESVGQTSRRRRWARFRRMNSVYMMSTGTYGSG